MPESATLDLSSRLQGGGGLELGRVLMCVQAFQLVWPKVREWIRTCWNACAKEENQCPVRRLAGWLTLVGPVLPSIEQLSRN